MNQLESRVGNPLLAVPGDYARFAFHSHIYKPPLSETLVPIHPYKPSVALLGSLVRIMPTFYCLQGPGSAYNTPNFPREIPKAGSVLNGGEPHETET